MLSALKVTLIAAALAATLTQTADAKNDAIRVESQLPVGEAVGRLTAAVEKAGARVFLTVNFQEGVASIGETIRPTMLVVFGSPKIGGKVFNASQTIGLYLPLRILAYEDEAGKVWLMYRDPADAAEEHGIATDHPAIRAMQGALKKMTSIAAGG